jgi:hypothetical protein
VARAKNKMCLDCLHCKVSARSTENNRLCYCGKAEKARNHKECYWLAKKICDAFESMDWEEQP